MNKKTWYPLLLVVSGLLTLGALLTLIPNPAAAKPNILGYKSICPFAPAATFGCALLAGITCTIRARLIKRPKATGPLKANLILAAIFLAGLIGFWFVYQAELSGYQRLIAAAKPTATLSTKADGEYTGSYESEGLRATVSVTIRQGAISAARLVSGGPQEQDTAPTLLPRIVQGQSLAVDAVAGATASSTIILKAVEAALK